MFGSSLLLPGTWRRRQQALSKPPYVPTDMRLYPEDVNPLQCRCKYHKPQLSALQRTMHTARTVFLSLGRDRTQMDLQMRSATVIRFFKTMLRTQVSPAGQKKWGCGPWCRSLTPAASRSVAGGSACSKLRWIMWQLPAHYRLPAVNHLGLPPDAIHVCVSDWPNQLYTYTPRQAHGPLNSDNFSNTGNTWHMFSVCTQGIIF